MRYLMMRLAKKHIMLRAWHIARKAEKKHGGKSKYYIPESLKKAWREWKEW